MSVMTTHQRQKNRGGVSLLEILICVGILSIGLLGVAALIPAGHFAVVETTKADRSVACAKAAKAEVQVRGMLKPEEWRYYDTASSSWANYPADYLPGCTVILDPLGMATAVDTGEETNAAKIQLNASPLPNISHIYRLTTNDLCTLPFEMSDLICHWADDTLIKIDDTNPDQRPRQIFASNHATDNLGPYPTIPTDDPPIQGTLLSRKSQGDFSWFLTVTPNMTEVLHPADEIQSLDVSVAVCYKRIIDFSTASGTILPERLADVDSASFTGICGSGASDIPLQKASTVPAGVDALEYLDVKPGQWIMLVGHVQDQKIDRYPSGGGTPDIAGYRTIAKWYRILSVDDEMDGDIRWVTVTGPEWIPGMAYGEMQNTQAIIVDSVIGVFTETMTLDR